MTIALADLQEAIQNTQKLTILQDYYQICRNFLDLILKLKYTELYHKTEITIIFYQYHQTTHSQITRPINTRLFIEIVQDFDDAWQQFSFFLQNCTIIKNRLLACLALMRISAPLRSINLSTLFSKLLVALATPYPILIKPENGLDSFLSCSLS